MYEKDFKQVFKTAQTDDAIHKNALDPGTKHKYFSSQIANYRACKLTTYSFDVTMSLASVSRVLMLCITNVMAHIPHLQQAVKASKKKTI